MILLFHRSADMMTLTIDEGILQVFEEQEDQFYFPVISQKTARSFVKALHAKGLSYEDLCKEIDEFEHNFSAWRKGLGRVGIGRRILQRINAPLQVRRIWLYWSRQNVSMVDFHQ